MQGPSPHVELDSLVRNHALVDGNERLAWRATVVSRDLNDRTVTLDDGAAFALVMAAAPAHEPAPARGDD